jgi:hypothetical protein
VPSFSNLKYNRHGSNPHPMPWALGVYQLISYAGALGGLVIFWDKA